MSAPGYAKRPPFWRWFEPPRWFPAWLHVLTCTFCRGMSAHVRSEERKLRQEATP